jgi:hypothetical protein
MLVKIGLVLDLGAVSFAEVGSLSKVVVAIQDQSLCNGRRSRFGGGPPQSSRRQGGHTAGDGSDTVKRGLST